MDILLIQAIGLLGYAIYIYSSRLPTRTFILLAEILGCMVLIMHWSLLGETITVCTNLIAMYTAIIGIAMVRFPRTSAMLWLCFPFLGVAAYLSYDAGIAFYFALGGSSAIQIAKFFKNLIYLRTFSILSGVSWAVYSVMVFSIPALLFAVFFALGHFLKLLEYDSVKAYFRLPQNTRENLGSPVDTATREMSQAV